MSSVVWGFPNPQAIIVEEATIKRYVAVINQTGTAAPTANVLVNTLGEDVVWSRLSAGRYQATCSVFKYDKTFCTQFPSLQYQNTLLFWNISITNGWMTAFLLNPTAEFILETYNNVGNEEWSVVFGNPFYLEILVYP